MENLSIQEQAKILRREGTILERFDKEKEDGVTTGFFRRMARKRILYSDAQRRDKKNQKTCRIKLDNHPAPCKMGAINKQQEIAL